jgi:hypothetical protein
VKFSDLIKHERSTRVKPKGWSDIDEISAELGVGYDRARRVLRPLIKAGKVEMQSYRTLTGHRNIYRVVKK